MADAAPVPPPSEGDLDRFRAKVAIRDDGCWEWTGARFMQGYGMFYLAGKARRAHRVFYCWMHGDPELPLDHLCNNRWCVNPEHLEPKTVKENVLRGEGLTAANSRKTHCAQGHEFTEENTYVDPRGWRQCRACGRLSSRRYSLRDR